MLQKRSREERNEYHRNRYARLTPQERQDHIQRVKNAAERRKLGQAGPSKLTPKLHELKKVACCSHCFAKRFQFEPPTFCCSNGDVILTSSPTPDDLYNLFTSTTSEGTEFRRYIRAYNSIFSFTSFGVRIDKDLANLRSGIYTFRAQGQIYHELPSIPQSEKGPCYLQLYFYDTDNELQNRMRILQNGNLKEPIVRKLIDIMSSNPYAQFFRRLKDIPTLDNYDLIIRSDIRLDQRVYNSPSADQVAAVWVEGNNANMRLERDIIVNSHSGRTHRVKHYFGCYDPLQYPLLFPNGEVGWHRNIKKKHQACVVTDITCEEDIFENSIDATNGRGHEDKKAKKVSCRQYYCYKLQIRENCRSIILCAGRLLQQYVVDMYIKLETTRLDFFRNQQSHIRSELYQGIVDCVSAGETRGDKIGKRIVLPSSFIGGPRDMRRRYLDAMSLVQRFGKPDFFITMTCNPEWKEIVEELKPGQHAQDRPDLTSRVFRAKFQDLKHQLFNKYIFGNVAAHVHVIEFQKRGLPHAHILLILQSECKITNADQYDKYVCAEIPNQSENPVLYDRVTKHMMHGPCGNLNQKNACMKGGKCKNHYPRQFVEHTIQGKDSYPIYKRSKHGPTVLVRKQYLDNRWVVPYNPYLLERYDCHINVEICSGLRAVKYLYKYIYKGHDRVAVYISLADGDNTIDEIREYQDARWVSPQEAMWRIFEFNLNEIYPSVTNLQLHLPNKHMVWYWEHRNLESVIRSDDTSRTMLTEFFDLNVTSEKARSYLYREIPEHYVWKKETKHWATRLGKDAIGRVNAANPSEGERYYLRLLLNHVRGPTSFQDLLSLNGVQYSSFKESAQKRGLLESDNSIVDCLNDAVCFQMPNTLRRLFATLLVYCEPTNVRKLWDDYFEAMSEDFNDELDSNTDLRGQRTLKSIDHFLQNMGRTIKDYDLPCIMPFEDQNVGTCKDIVDELSVVTPIEDFDAISTLNPQQKNAYDIILERVKTNRPGVFFIDGPGGTGKTYLYRTLLARLRSEKEIAIATATSGVAASILPGGRTAHSRFKIPIIANETTICNISKQGAHAELLRRAKLIIWDEAPMAKRFAIETLDRSLQDILCNTSPFGGKVIVFGGDFRQVLPVVPRGTRAETVAVSLVESHLWQKMEKIQLSRNMRARSDPSFGEFLLRVGNGEEPTIGDAMIRLPDEMVINYDSDDGAENELIDNVFPSLLENAYSVPYITSRAILATKNEFVDRLNEKLIEHFPGDLKMYHSFDKATDDAQTYYQEEFLNSLAPNGLPPHKLNLKIGCPIMLLRNLDASNGLCNGTRLICRGLQNNVIHAEICSGQHARNQVLIPRIPLSPAENEGFPFHFTRKQFPIRLSFAMTINKAQGQTIPHVGIYLPQHVFSHGQLYVALSRGTSKLTTKVLIGKESNVNLNGTFAKNVVYKEVLLPNR